MAVSAKLAAASSLGQLDLSPAQLCNAVLAELVLGVPRDAFPVVVMVFFAVVVCLLCHLTCMILSSVSAVLSSVTVCD